MKNNFWVFFSLACLGLAPMATSPFFGPIINNSLRESLISASLLIGFLSAGWIFQIYFRANKSAPPRA